MLVLLATGLIAGAASIRLTGQETPPPVHTGRVAGGWNVFARKHCLECHAIWGAGGEIGPDLGRIMIDGFSAAHLAGAMWNHVPTVRSLMLRQQLEFPSLDESEMNDLFSFLSFVRYLDEPGDPALGERILREKGCA
ncbi:MAG: hypothetical protein ACYTGC_02920, partial [Planctomycetota bacterium]